MSLSTLTAFDFIAENSFATPGLFNRIFSTISDNVGTMNSVAIGPATVSGSTYASINLVANSSVGSDYIRFVDSSAQRSTYRIGSFTGGTADGLNIYDESGQTMLASFSKQSIRFYQNVTGPVFDTGGALTSTLNAATLGDGSQSKESRIAAAIIQAAQQGLARVYIPSSMYPYSASSVSFIYTVQMVREGGDQSLYDVKAYGAYGDNVTDDTSAFRGAVSSAIMTQGTVFVPHSVNSYSISNVISLTGAVGLSIIGDSRGGAISQTSATCRIFSGGSISNIGLENLILGGSFTIGIAVSGITGCTIRGCNISGGTTRETTGLTHCGGILLTTASNVLIDNNTLSGNGVYGGAELVKGSDIQVGENGTNSSNIRILKNTCSSTSAKWNIGVFDTDSFVIGDNECSGARTLGTSGGYGILCYQQSVTSSLKNGRIIGNHVYNVEGSGIYLQTLIDGACAENVVANSGNSMTEGALVVGGIALANCVRVTVTGGSVRSSGVNGIVVSNSDPTTYGCKVTGVTVDTALGKGIRLGGACPGVTVVGNTVRNTTGVGIGNIDNGASTITMDHVVVTGNSLSSIGLAGISLSNAQNSIVAFNSIQTCGNQGIALQSGGSFNIVEGNDISGANTLTGFDDIYVSTGSSDVRNNICAGSVTLAGVGIQQLNNRASTVTVSGTNAASQIVVDGAGCLLLTRPDGTTFTEIRLGGNGAAFPALRRNGANLSVGLADSSTRGTIDALKFTAIGGAISETTPVAVTYASSMTCTATLANHFLITATNGTAFLVGVTGLGSGQRIAVRIKNASGGALGTGTFSSAFKMVSNTPTMPANGFGRTWRFNWDGTNAIEERADADVPN